jgi:hypothetical protein
MLTVVRAISINNRGYGVEVPDACPICHRHSEVQWIAGDTVENNNGVQVVWRCAYQRCRGYFICSYGPMPSPQLLSVRPLKPQAHTFPETIGVLSPTFISIFKEAEEATQLGLHQIAGPGYRKAFEFLIKDYAKSLAPDKTAEIESKFSGAVVSDFISDARIQAVAKRCLWLGNDETHYLRKWTDRDVADLVTLIKLTANWIEIEHLSNGYVQKMPE